jgi:hypothetical protein
MAINPSLITPFPYSYHPQQMYEMSQVLQEKQNNEDFQEIYDYINKKQKEKYKSKLHLLQNQLEEANKALDQAKHQPQKRTVKLQTKNPIAFINRGLNPIKFDQADEEISAQPTFRQDSLEKAVSEKLEEIERRAQEQSRKK